MPPVGAGLEKRFPAAAVRASAGGAGQLFDLRVCQLDFFARLAVHDDGPGGVSVESVVGDGQFRFRLSFVSFFLF